MLGGAGLKVSATPAPALWCHLPLLPPTLPGAGASIRSSSSPCWGGGSGGPNSPLTGTAAGAPSVRASLGPRTEAAFRQRPLSSGGSELPADRAYCQSSL